MLDDQQPEDGFTGGGVATIRQRQRMACPQVRADLGVRDIVLQQVIMFPLPVRPTQLPRSLRWEPVSVRLICY